MTDEAAVKQTLEEYYRAFSTLSVQTILPYLNQPALLVGPLGAIPLPTPSAIEPIFGPVMEGLRGRGYARSELGSLEIRFLGADSALATGIAIRFRSDGEELERAGISYLLRKTVDVWRLVVMVLHGAPSARPDLTIRELANDPQDLERLLVARENTGDVSGMTALFEPDAVVDIGDGTFLRGKEAIHEFFTKLQVTGFGPEKRKFEFGEQRPALICGDLALTSTRSRNGTVTSEVARRQKDGTWLWVIDRYSVSW